MQRRPMHRRRGALTFEVPAAHSGRDLSVHVHSPEANVLPYDLSATFDTP